MCLCLFLFFLICEHFFYPFICKASKISAKPHNNMIHRVQFQYLNCSDCLFSIIQMRVQFQYLNFSDCLFSIIQISFTYLLLLVLELLCWCSFSFCFCFGILKIKLELFDRYMMFSEWFLYFNWISLIKKEKVLLCLVLHARQNKCERETRNMWLFFLVSVLGMGFSAPQWFSAAFTSNFAS